MGFSKRETPGRRDSNQRNHVCNVYRGLRLRDDLRKKGVFSSDGLIFLSSKVSRGSGSDGELRVKRYRLSIWVFSEVERITTMVSKILVTRHFL